MKLSNELDKDKLWERMLDYEILGMTRKDLDHDDGILKQLKKESF